MDRGAWWAAVCGVTQSQTRLKRLSSSSSTIQALVEKFLNDLSLTSSIRDSEFLCVSPGVVNAQARIVLQNILLRTTLPLWASDSTQCKCVGGWGKREYKRTGKSRGPGTEQSVNNCQLPFPPFRINCQDLLA